MACKGDKLTSLTLSGCLNLEAAKLPPNLSLPELEVLHLSKQADRELTLSADFISGLIAASPKLKELNLRGCQHLHPNVLANRASSSGLEVLILEECCSIESNAINRLIADSPNLKALNLSACGQLDPMVLNQLLHPEKLEALSLGDTQINHDSLVAVLAKSTKLKVLNLSWYQNEFTDKEIEKLTLSSVTSFNFSNSEINSYALNCFLKRTPFLEELTVCRCNELRDSLDGALALSALKKLDVSGSSISDVSLSRLLSQATLLEALDISFACGEGEGDFMTLPIFHSLKTLNLQGSRIEPVFLTALLRQTSSVVFLDLSHCSNLSDFSGASLPLPLLKELNAAESSINSDLLSALLIKATLLENLNLEGCTELTEALDEDIFLPSLEVLNVSNSSLTSVSLSSLLNNASQLDDLNLSNCSDLGEPLKKAPPLESLKKINAFGANIDSDFLSSLLSSSPLLEEINIYGCNHIKKSLSKRLSLKQLRKFYAANTSFDFFFLTSFLKSTPSLEELTLSETSALSKDLDHASMTTPFIDEISLPLLRKLNLDGAIINPVLLSSVLSTVPLLEELDLRYCSQTSSVFVNEIFLPSLKNFNASESEIKPALLAALLSNARLLKTLNLSRCRNLSAESLETMNLSTLKVLDIMDMPMTKTALVKIVTHASNLDEIIVGKEESSFYKPNLLEKVSTYFDENPEQFEFPQPEEADFDEKAPALSNKAAEPLAKVIRERKKTESLDANTAPITRSYDLTRVFYSHLQEGEPAINQYRELVFDTIGIEPDVCELSHMGFLTNQSDELALETDNRVRREEEDTRALFDQSSSLSADHAREYYGRLSLNLTVNWQPLPSLSANERMTHYHVSPESTHIEIQYSQRDNLYYLKSDNELSVTFDFIINAPEVNTVMHDESIQAQLQACREFESKALVLEEGPLTGADYLTALKEQKVGACRHRTLVFKDWMNEHFSHIPVRIVNNECHSFIEIRDEASTQWTAFDLGGYPVTVTIKDSPVLLIRAQSQTLVQRTSEGRTTENALLIEGPSLPHYFPKEVRPKIPSSGKQYIQTLLNDHKKALVLFKDNESVEAFSLSLKGYSASSTRACFHIQKPEDLNCLSPYLKRDDKTMRGTVTQGPGGPLYDFLMRNQNSNPLIIVDYRTIPSATFNTLLDEVRSIDSILIPQKAVIIGLSVPSQPSASNGADAYSRFDAPPAFCPLPKETFLQPFPISEKTSEETLPLISFFNTPYWERKLLGHWKLSGQALYFVQGELMTALDNKATAVDLNHAPWQNKAFARFIQEALHSRVIKTPYGDYPLPEGFEFKKSEGYPWGILSKTFDIQPMTQADLVLNPTRLAPFLSQFICDPEIKTIQSAAGLLEEYKGKLLPLYVSATLNEDDWARFLTACQQLNVHLNPVCAPGVSLPEALGIKAPVLSNPTQLAWNRERIDSDYVINSSDPDLTKTQIKADLMIDVSDLESSDLLIKMEGTFNKEALSFRFEERKGALISALERGETILLTGNFSPTLIDTLEAFLLERQQEKAKMTGGVILLPDQQELFPILPAFEHRVSLKEKKEALRKQGLSDDTYDDEVYEQRSLCELQCRLMQDDPWIGMASLPAMPEDQSSAEPDDFMAQRMSVVETLLKKSPFVFLAGKSGVGKSSFVQEYWKEKYPHFYFGEASLKAWASVKPRAEELITLFIDEANISSKNWREFEGLFNEPPGIMIESDYITLTPQHKVIFAGNPLSYGGERTLPRLFERHGKSLLFEPLPPKFLQKKVLEPLFEKIEASKYSIDALTEPALKVSEFLTRIDPNEVLISPRELRQMALSTLAYCQKNPTQDPIVVAEYFAYTLSKELVPKGHKKDFEALWKSHPLLARSQEVETSSVSLNTSNQAAFDALHDALDVRQLKIKTPGERLGGLGGVIIEGEAGLGKSELAISVLRSQGIRKACLETKPAEEKHEDNTNYFYLLPVSASLQEKKKLLKQAFHEGAIVVIDEINTAAMMERELNELLMEKCEGEAAKKPGFLIIGTQNPPTYAGRVIASKALQRRLNKVTINEYSSEELITILIKKGLKSETATDMVKEYLERKSSNDALCCRDLIKRAKQEIKREASLGLVQTLSSTMSNGVAELSRMHGFFRDFKQADESHHFGPPMPDSLSKGIKGS